MRQLSASVAFVSLFFGSLMISPAKASSDLRTDIINVYFDPDFPLPEGQSLLDYYKSKRYVYVYREIIPVEVAGDTYFAMLGANGGYPDFYGGIQYFKDGRKAAIFSAWDVGADGSCSTCQPGTAAPENQVSVWAKGPRTSTKPFGYEGTGMNSMIYDFDWKIGQKVAMLASVEPAGSGSLISAAIKNGDAPWEFMTSFYVPTRYDMGMSGNYSFLEDFGSGDETLPRSYLVGPSYLEDEDAVGTHFTNVYVGAHNPRGTKIADKHKISVEGSWLRVRTGIPQQVDAKPEYRIQLAKPREIPEIAAGKSLLALAVAGKSTRFQERVKRLELEAKAREEAEANAKAEAAAKARLDAIQKSEAEARVSAKKTNTVSCLKGKKKVLAKDKCPAGYKRVKKSS